jgi:hypothetical protein
LDRQSEEDGIDRRPSPLRSADGLVVAYGLATGVLAMGAAGLARRLVGRTGTSELLAPLLAICAVVVIAVLLARPILGRLVLALRLASLRPRSCPAGDAEQFDDADDERGDGPDARAPHPWAELDDSFQDQEPGKRRGHDEHPHAADHGAQQRDRVPRT